MQKILVEVSRTKLYFLSNKSKRNTRVLFYWNLFPVSLTITLMVWDNVLRIDKITIKAAHSTVIKISSNFSHRFIRKIKSLRIALLFCLSTLSTTNEAKCIKSLRVVGVRLNDLAKSEHIFSLSHWLSSFFSLSIITPSDCDEKVIVI